MNRLLISVSFIFMSAINLFAQQQIITVNNPNFPESNFSLEELIEEVLVTGGCSEVDNFSSQTFGRPEDLNNKSYGYFTRGTASNFPFEEGIIISSGSAGGSGNVADTNLLNNIFGTPGDSDLETALEISATNDATFVKFNFTPTANRISFRFLMASEEYAGDPQPFECNFSDGFAFLLRVLGDSTYENIALLPNGEDVTVPNISAYPTCQQNSEFFEGYNTNIQVAGEFGNLSDTNYNGRTVVLVAEADVTPGTTYEIKLVVADQGDGQFDSAIFLEAGSFNLGGELGEDLTIANGNAPCGNTEVTLDTNAPDAEHTWFKDGEEIEGQSSSMLNVFEPGVYSVVTVFDVGCSLSDSIIVEFRPSAEVQAEPYDLAECSLDDTAFFDLTVNNQIVLGTQNPDDFNISFHLTNEDAEERLNQITDPLNYESTDNREIFMRIEDVESGICGVIQTFILNVFSEVSATASIFAQCDNSLDGDDGNGFAEFDLTLLDVEVLGGQDPGDFRVSYHRTQEDADASDAAITSPYTNVLAGTDVVFARVENISNPDCYATASVGLVVEVLPTVVPGVELFQCD
ncbi:MAG: choice-of-anchor L domain-containing protein, partial [Bacteroidota bacterium]